MFDTPVLLLLRLYMEPIYIYWPWARTKKTQNSEFKKSRATRYSCLIGVHISNWMHKLSITILKIRISNVEKSILIRGLSSRSDIEFTANRRDLKKQFLLINMELANGNHYHISLMGYHHVNHYDQLTIDSAMYAMYLVLQHFTILITKLFIFAFNSIKTFAEFNVDCTDAERPRSTAIRCSTAASLLATHQLDASSVTAAQAQPVKFVFIFSIHRTSRVLVNTIFISW